MDSTPRNEPVIPEQEKHQPDPMLQMSVGRMSAGAVTRVIGTVVGRFERIEPKRRLRPRVIY